MKEATGVRRGWGVGGGGRVDSFSNPMCISIPVGPQALSIQLRKTFTETFEVILIQKKKKKKCVLRSTSRVPRLSPSMCELTFFVLLSIKAGFCRFLPLTSCIPLGDRQNGLLSLVLWRRCFLLVRCTC